MTNKETVRLYLTDELRDSTRGMFSLEQIAKDVGLGVDDLTISLRQLVFDKVIAIFEQDSADDIFIELQL